MIVFGDHAACEDPRRLLAASAARLRSVTGLRPGVARHDRLVAALIEAGMLAQGIADAEMERLGHDHRSPVQAAAMALLRAIAEQVGASWTSGFRSAGEPDRRPWDALATAPLPASVTVRQPEGFAHYALYPEAYFEAGRRLAAASRIVGLRSIGTTLAAMAAAGAGTWEAPITLRPVGHPFRREIRIGADLRAEIAAAASGVFAIVDEGPGLSGSSFAAAADLLEAAGVAPERIVFLPGHAGAPGTEASPRHRTRWSVADRRVVGFDEVVLPRLAKAVADLTGPALAPLQDLSGGRWREHIGAAAADWPPVHAMQERRKFLLTSASGTWLLKFAGLGEAGARAFERARRHHAAGFGAEALGVRLGFLVERWEGRVAPVRLGGEGRGMLLHGVGRYLAHRAGLAAEGPGASRAALAGMAHVNIAEALGTDAAATWAAGFGDGSGLCDPVPVETDNRLHAWEWRQGANGRLIKTDAIDHGRAHDLIGCQDIAWDIAGAAIEFECSGEEAERLVAAVVAAGRPVSRPLLRWMGPAYLAFQIGLWTMASAQASGEERARIEALLARYRGQLRRRLIAGGESMMLAENP